MDKLTAKQERFCQEYVGCNQAREASRRSGYHSDTGAKLLKMPLIASFIQNLRDKQKIIPSAYDYIKSIQLKAVKRLEEILSCETKEVTIKSGKNEGYTFTTGPKDSDIINACKELLKDVLSEQKIITNNYVLAQKENPDKLIERVSELLIQLKTVVKVENSGLSKSVDSKDKMPSTHRLETKLLSSPDSAKNDIPSEAERKKDSSKGSEDLL